MVLWDPPLQIPGGVGWCGTPPCGVVGGRGGVAGWGGTLIPPFDGKTLILSDGGTRSTAGGGSGARAAANEGNDGWEAKEREVWWCRAEGIRYVRGWWWGRGVQTSTGGVKKKQHLGASATWMGWSNI